MPFYFTFYHFVYNWIGICSLMLFLDAFIYILYYIYFSIQFYLFNYCYPQGPVEYHILCERVTMVKDQK